MATIYKCDGCDKEFKTKRGNLTEIGISRRNDDDKYSADNVTTELDLCVRCRSQFETFIRNLQEVRAAD